MVDVYGIKLNILIQSQNSSIDLIQQGTMTIIHEGIMALIHQGIISLTIVEVFLLRSLFLDPDIIAIIPSQGERVWSMVAAEYYLNQAKSEVCVVLKLLTL